MKRYPCRCKICRARRTLAKHPDAYRREPKCPCGGSYSPDSYRRTKEHKLTACYCSGYHWSINNGPHRRGSPECYYHDEVRN